jgi:hypothetical protein
LPLQNYRKGRSGLHILFESGMSFSGSQRQMAFRAIENDENECHSSKAAMNRMIDVSAYSDLQSCYTVSRIGLEDIRRKIAAASY